MKKRIAVFMCAISLDHQKEILDGIIAYAKKNRIDVFIFSCYVNYREQEMNKQGAFKIMELPDLSQFDGAIIAKNTIRYFDAAERIAKRIVESGIPAVSIDYPVEGIGKIGTQSYHAQAEIVRHIICEHGVRDVYYIAGPMNEQGRQRYQAYLDVLKEYGIPFREQNVYHGTFAEDSGRKGVEWFLAEGGCPKAIVCANDNMAIGAMDCLKEHGYQIPEDVLVTGYDNGARSRYYLPALTTVERNSYETGYQAMEMVDTGDWHSVRLLDTKVAYRASCGCTNRKFYDAHRLREEYMEHLTLTEQVSDRLKDMSLEFSDRETPEELIHTLKKYVKASDAQSFYLCMCEREKVFECGNVGPDGDIDLMEVNENYTDEIDIALAYEDGMFQKGCRLWRGEVLPREYSANGEGKFYVVVPLYFQNCCYGYCIYGNSLFPMKSELFYSWVGNISIGLENVRKGMLLRETVRQLNGMWVYDMLTHVYNRAGFFHYAGKLMKKRAGSRQKACIIFADIDGLKKVNDTYGHDRGDLMICEMADILKAAKHDDQLLMRYGGDEFVLFEFQEEKQGEKQVEEIRERMRRCNVESGYEFQIDASMGIIYCELTDAEELGTRIEEADQRMYEEKRAKKRTRE